MRARIYAALTGMLLISACRGEHRAEPVADIKVTDRRAETARERVAEPRLLRALASPAEHDRLIYDPPVNLARQLPDTTVTSTFGVAVPDTVRAGQRTGGARADSARRPR